jgi:hypothetical protein
MELWTKTEFQYFKHGMRKLPTTSDKLASHPEDNIKIHMDKYPMMLRYRPDKFDSVYNKRRNFDKSVK